MSGVLYFPWCIKPIFGYIFDKLMIRLGKPKYIIICTSLVRVIVFSGLANFKFEVYSFHFSLLLISFCQLFENILCEYLLLLSTKRANLENGDIHENHLPYFYGFRALGTLFG